MEAPSDRLGVGIADRTERVDMPAGTGVLGPAIAGDTKENAGGAQRVAEVVQPHAGHRDPELPETAQIQPVLELPHGREIHIAVPALDSFEALPGIAL